MGSKMLPRDRVQMAMSFQEPDRVPIAIGGGPYGIVDELYKDLLKFLSLGSPVKPFRSGHSISYMDDRLLEKLGTDFRYVYPTLSPSSPYQQADTPDTFLDAFGQKWKRAIPYFYADKGILSEIHKIDQIDEIVNWPDSKDPRWFAGVRKRAQELHESTAYWITARMVVSHGPFQYASDLRGMENFMMDMVMKPDLASALLKKIGGIYCGLYENYLIACGDFIDMIELPGDDYAGNNNLILSPEMFRKFIKPIIKQMVDRIKSYNEDIKIMLHSDGVITKLIPELIDVGIDVLHPLEPLPATNQSEVKKNYTDRLVFLGGIDISKAMPGSEQDVILETKRCINQLARGGGYILAPSNHLQSDISVENVVLLFNTARLYGNYPIKI